MSLELSSDENPKPKNNSKEYKWKELLYELFYEIKSEILGCKIEIEEDEYQENIRTTTIPKLVSYIHDSIQILIKKKIEDSKNEQKEEDEKYYQILYSKNNTNNPLSLDEKAQYENIIRKLEAKERILSKINFQDKLQKDAMENKIGEYMEMEEEFEEMKTKLKYEDGRFLNNDRKDNEIIIIRGENSNLKKSIKNLEQQIINFEKDKKQKNEIINKLQNEINQFKIKLEEAEKQNEILNSHSINININNVTGTNNKNGVSQNNNNTNNNNNKMGNMGNNTNKNNDKNKLFPYQKIKAKILNNKNHNDEILSNTRNESLEKINSNLLNKILVGNKVNKTNTHLNNSCVKVNHYPLANNQKQNFFNNNSSNNMPFFNRNNMKNMKNFNIMKKIMPSGGNNSSRSNSTKIKGKPNKAINYRSVS